MNMIDVIKRLAELDAKNPNMVKEGLQTEVAACGMSPMPGMGGSSTPASVNITAGSGEELSNMLKDIMSLAGVHRVEPHELGAEPEPMTLTAEPMTAMGPAPSAGDNMRAVMDKINGDDTDGEDEDDKETDEGQYDNTPTGVDDVPSFKKDAMIDKGRMNQDPAGHPGVGDRMDGDRPKAFATMEESLMDEYKKFVAEGDGYDQWAAGFNPKDITAKPSKTLARLMRIPGFDKVSPQEQQRVSKAVDDYLARGMSFDQASVLAQKRGMSEGASSQELENSAETMTLDQFVSVYGEENEHIWHEVNGQQGVAEGDMDDLSHRSFKKQELQHELGHEVDPIKFAVAIDGRTWKTFDDQRQAENIARSLRAKGKKATVHSA